MSKQKTAETKNPKPNKIVYGVSKFLWRQFFHNFTGFRLEGSENLPQKGPMLVVSNHTSIIDIFAVGIILKPYLTYPGKRESFDDPRTGIYLRAMGGFSLDRDILDVGTAKILIRLLREGACIGIMPEGTRSIDGQVQRFKPGFIKLAIMTRTPILLVAIKGMHKVLPKGTHIPKRNRVTLIVDKPFELSEFYGKKLNEVQVQEIADNVQKQLIDLLSR